MARILLPDSTKWQFIQLQLLANDLADFATLGGATHRASFVDLASLAQYLKIVAIYDADSAGDKARQYLSSLPRFQIINPPAHDLTDYFRTSGDVYAWVESILT